MVATTKIVALGALSGHTLADPPPIWPDPTHSWDVRVNDLVGRLTLDEKVAQLGHYDLSDPDKSLGRASSPPIPRLGIDGYNYGTECNTGIQIGFPQNIAMAATFNRSVLSHAGRGTGLGLRAHPYVDGGNPEGYRGLSCWSPMINIMRHPLWGRNHEGYGEDPFLAGELTAAVVKGMQGDDPRYALINAGCKHFAVFDGPGNGGEANISGVDWMTTYMPAFKKCFESGALSTMCTYAKLNGTYGCQNPTLLTTYLRDYMKFEGYVVSDQGAIHDATASINAGCDIEDGFGQYAQLLELEKNGTVEESTIDRSLRRAFYVRFRHGEFDPPSMVPYQNESQYGEDAFDKEFYSNVSLQAARQSIALLKNEAGFLPLDLATQPKVAVFGCLVREQRTGGNIYSDCQVAATAGYSTAPRATAPPADILKDFGFDAAFVQGWSSSDIAPAASAADVAVVFIGRAGSEGESGDWCTDRTCGDNDDMSVPVEQAQLLSEVLASGTPTVVVFYNCNPLDVEDLIAHQSIRAVLHAFYPEVWAGQAVAEVLAGRFAPAGRMPYSWVRSLADSGNLSDYDMTGTSKTYRYWQSGKQPPLFPFGFGLSYTKFEYSKLGISPVVAKPCDDVTVTVTLHNAGQTDSDEVVQVYAQWLEAALPTPQRQLVGFERVHLPAGEALRLSIVIRAEQLAMVDDSQAAPGVLPVWMAAPAKLALSIGGQQPEQTVAAPSNVLSGSFMISGSVRPLDECNSVAVV